MSKSGVRKWRVNTYSQLGHGVEVYDADDCEEVYPGTVESLHPVNLNLNPITNLAGTKYLKSVGIKLHLNILTPFQCPPRKKREASEAG